MLITNVRVFDGTQMIGPSTVAVDGDRIGDPTSIGTTCTRVLDGNGGTLLPGLIDAHIHLSGQTNLERARAWGVTTMLDMGTRSPRLVDSLRATPGVRTSVALCLRPAPQAVRRHSSWDTHPRPL